MDVMLPTVKHALFEETNAYLYFLYQLLHKIKNIRLLLNQILSFHKNEQLKCRYNYTEWMTDLRRTTI